MRIATILGARPQFIKAAVVSRAISKCRNQRKEIHEEIIHTGQHYDPKMSANFFRELEIPEPRYNLNIHGGSHGQMTARMLADIEQVLIDRKPDMVMVYGDTNSTLAGSLAAVKLHIPIAHVEAGLRSFNHRMPEEINRIITDRISQLLFCPTEAAVNNLRKENITNGVHFVGDVMLDALLYYDNTTLWKIKIVDELSLVDRKYGLVTIHRAENTDSHDRLCSILKALESISENIPLIFPMHPRTKKIIAKHNYTKFLKNIKVIEPLSYLEMLKVESCAAVIITDSGGIQKEAFIWGIPCITVRDETEWVETVESGLNHIVGAGTESIVSRFQKIVLGKKDVKTNVYGDGNAGEKIVGNLLDSVD